LYGKVHLHLAIHFYKLSGMSPIITPLSPTAVAAYQDLRRMMIDEAVAGMRGRPILRERAGRSYWYDQFRVGDAVKERYIGEDGPALRDRIAHHRDLADRAAARRSERARLVRVLRAEGMTSMDRQSGSLLRALSLAGVFRVGGVLVGTQAFRLYEGELGVRIAGADLAMTLDFDIAAFERLSLTIGDAVDAAPTDILKPFDFAPVPELDRDSVWRWKQSKSQALVEFLTPSFEEDEGIKPLKSLGVSARALRHLNYLIADPIQAVGLYREGVLIRDPPARALRDPQTHRRRPPPNRPRRPKIPQGPRPGPLPHPRPRRGPARGPQGGLRGRPRPGPEMAGADGRELGATAGRGGGVGGVVGPETSLETRQTC
jgi:hypothetical protein